VNAEPLVPVAVPALVITGGMTAAATVIASVRESVPLAFEALIVTLVVPAESGVPVIAPD
jgi:hypothetical protein